VEGFFISRPFPWLRSTIDCSPKPQCPWTSAHTPWSANRHFEHMHFDHSILSSEWQRGRSIPCPTLANWTLWAFSACHRAVVSLLPHDLVLSSPTLDIWRAGSAGHRGVSSAAVVEIHLQIGNRTGNRLGTEYAGTAWNTVYVRACKCLREKDGPLFCSIHNPKVGGLIPHLATNSILITCMGSASMSSRTRDSTAS